MKENEGKQLNIVTATY